MRLMLVFGAVLMLSVVAEAKDFCVQADETASSHTLFVGKNFSVPGKGKCKPWLGFVSGFWHNSAGTTAPLGLNMQTTGVGCTASDSSHLTISILEVTGSNVASFQPEDIVVLPLPALTGGTDTFVGNSIPAAVVNCPSQPVPVL